MSTEARGNGNGDLNNIKTTPSAAVVSTQVSTTTTTTPTTTTITTNKLKVDSPKSPKPPKTPTSTSSGHDASGTDFDVVGVTEETIENLRKELDRLKLRLEEERKKLNDVSCMSREKRKD